MIHMDNMLTVTVLIIILTQLISTVTWNKNVHYGINNSHFIKVCQSLYTHRFYVII